MRDIKELLKILLEFLESEEGKRMIKLRSGLCYCINFLIYNAVLKRPEGHNLERFILIEAPKISKLKFWKWDPGLYEPRLEWLKEQVK